MHRSRCTRVHLQTPRCVYVKKKGKEGGNWSVVIIPSCCPSTLLHFSHFSFYSCRLSLSSLRFTRGPRASPPAHSWRWTEDETIRGNHWLLGPEASWKPGWLHLSSERYNNHASPHFMVRRLPSNGKYISLAAALPPSITHTLNSIFPPIFCCSFSVPAFWTALSVCLFFLTDGKSRSQKKEQKLHWIADDSVEFPNSLPGQTRTPEKFGRIPVRSASQAQPFMKFSSRLNPASGNQLFSSCKYGSFV